MKKLTSSFLGQVWKYFKDHRFRVKTDIVQQGTFTYSAGEQTYGSKMQHAALTFYRFLEMGTKENEVIQFQKEENDGIYFIIDLQSENAGYLDFNIEVPEECQMEIGWGEHLEDGRCRTEILMRNFSVTVKLNRGRNYYLNPFRRLEHYIELCEVMEIDNQQKLYIKKELNNRIVETFYNKKTGLFYISNIPDAMKYSVLANAWGYLCGAADGLDIRNMMNIIMQNESKDPNLQVIPTTLSMNTFRYEALLKYDRELYKNNILDEIDQSYFNMLMKGATSFWETGKGDKDFEFAGSLCHGLYWCRPSG